MSTEKRILLGLSRSELRTSLKNQAAKLGFTTYSSSQGKDCIDRLQRKAFTVVFVERALLREITRHYTFSASTYLVLIVSEKEVTRALSLQRAGKIHDWLSLSGSLSDISSMLLRARTFAKQASDLDAMRTTTAQATSESAIILLTGAWAKTAEAWIKKVGPLQGPLLISGETGSGKRHFAELIHFKSERASEPLITIQCDHRNPAQIEKDLFGNANRRSKLSLAGEGTLLLDQADGLRRNTQIRLARTIEHRAFSPIGGGESIPFLGRVILTIRTSPKEKRVGLVPQLAKLVKKTRLSIPPLRERPHDLSMIGQNILNRIAQDLSLDSLGLTEGALELIKKHPWVGNLRELERVLWTASLQNGNGKISRRYLSGILQNGKSSKAVEEEALEELVKERLDALFHRFGAEHMHNLHPMVLERVERPLLSLVLQQSRGNQLRAAKILGINRNTLRRKMKQYAIPLP